MSQYLYCTATVKLKIEKGKFNQLIKVNERDEIFFFDIFKTDELTQSSKKPQSSLSKAIKSIKCTKYLVERKN